MSRHSDLEWLKDSAAIDLDDNDKSDADVFDVNDATIHRVTMISNKMLHSLCAHFFESRVDIDFDRMPYEAAATAWQQDPRFVQRRQHGTDEDVTQIDVVVGDDNMANDKFAGTIMENSNKIADIEDVLSEAMLVHGAENFSVEREDMYKRHTLATTIRATVIIKYDGGKKCATVVNGTWFCLSSSIKLHIRGKIMKSRTTNGMMMVDAGLKSSRIEMAVPFDTISGKQFFNLLRESGIYPLPVVHKYTSLLFAKPSSKLKKEKSSSLHAEREPQNVREAREQANAYEEYVKEQIANTGESIEVVETGEQRVNKQIADNQQMFDIAANTVLKPKELRDRVIASNDMNLEKMLRAPFVSLGLNIVLYAPELTFIAAIYESIDSDVWRNALCRGANFIDALYEALTTKPHILCFKKKRKEFGRERGVPIMAQLPDLTAEKFDELVTTFDLQEKIGPEIRVAIAIHKNILHADVYGKKQIDYTAMQNGEFVPHSGHMFSVLAAHPDDAKPSYFHGDPKLSKNEVVADSDKNTSTNRNEKLYDENPYSYSGRFYLGEKGREIPSSMKIMLAPDRKRCGEEIEHKDFVAALHWLKDNHLIVVERFKGTGTHNFGLDVDAFYLAEIHEMQQQFVGVVADIVERGVHQATVAPVGVDDLCSVDLFALHGIQKAKFEEWAGRYPEAIKDMAVRLALEAATKANKESEPVVAEPEDDASISLGSSSLSSKDGDEESADDGDGENDRNEANDHDDDGEPRKKKKKKSISLIKTLAQEIARFSEKWRQMYDANTKMMESCGQSTEDAYADIRKDKAHMNLPLLKIAELVPFTKSGQPLAPEQIQCLTNFIQQPCVSTLGRGGTGKSEIIDNILNMYADGQVLVVTPTSSVANDITQRTGRKAHTIASVLTRHSYYLEAYYRALSFRKRALQYRRKAQDSNGKTTGTLYRAETFTKDDVYACNDDRELRAYIDHMLGCFPPFVSPMRGVRAIIIDEMSLAGIGLILRLLQAGHAPEHGFMIEKIGFFGDIDQLPALSYGSPQSDLTHGMPNFVTELIKNQRSRGHELFNLAQAIAEHRAVLPMPNFSSGTSAYRSISAGSPIVALECKQFNLVQTVENVLVEMGAVKNVPLRDDVQFITTTNAAAKLVNATVRWKYFGEAIMRERKGDTRDVRSMLTDPKPDISNNSSAASNHEETSIETQTSLNDATEYHTNDELRTMRNEARIKRRKLEADLTAREQQKAKEVEEFDVEKFIVETEKRQAEEKQMRETIGTQLHMQIRVGDWIYPTKNYRCVYPATNLDQRREVIFSNSRRLKAVGFYDAPFRTSPHQCRCGLCHKPKEADKNFVFPCKRRLDLVPEGRRAVSMRISYHDAGLARSASNGMRRMAVFVDHLGNYVEMDVSRLLAPRSRYDNGFCLTTHRLQGSQCKIAVYVCIDDRWYLDWRYGYTAITRAQNGALILSSMDVFQSIMRRKTPRKRSSMWLMIMIAVRNILRKYPTSSAAKFAQKNYPGMMQDSSSVVDTDEKWELFEKARYRTNGGDETAPPLSTTATSTSSKKRKQRQLIVENEDNAEE